VLKQTQYIPKKGDRLLRANSILTCVEEEADYSTLMRFLVLFLAFGMATVSLSLLFVPVDFMGYTGFVLVIDVILAIPLVGYARELWLQHRVDATIGPK